MSKRNRKNLKNFLNKPKRHLKMALLPEKKFFVMIVVRTIMKRGCTYEAVIYKMEQRSNGAPGRGLAGVSKTCNGPRKLCELKWEMGLRDCGR